MFLNINKIWLLCYNKIIW